MKLSKHRKHNNRQATTTHPAAETPETAAAQGVEQPAAQDMATAGALPRAGATDETDGALVRQVLAGQGAIAQTLIELSGQNALQRQQLNQVYAAVGQLYQAVSTQCQQLLQSDTNLQQEFQKELQKFQTGGPQRAMTGLFHKLFRDLIKHANELDEVVARRPTQVQDPVMQSWFDAIRIVRDRFEVFLKDWGCVPMAIAVGTEEFDPERHEAIEAEPGDVPPDAPAHVIVKVRRRGWLLSDQILQYPQVVVS